MSKTKLILVGAETPCQYGMAENLRLADDPREPMLHTKSPNPGEVVDLEPPKDDSRTSVSFEPTDDQNRAFYSR